MKATEQRKPLTPEERQIKREEDQCWKQYWNEQKALLARAESDIEAAYKQLQTGELDTELGGEELTPLDLKESREAGARKRENDTRSKGRRKKILATRSGRHERKSSIAKAKYEDTEPIEEA